MMAKKPTPDAAADAKAAEAAAAEQVAAEQAAAEQAAADTKAAEAAADQAAAEQAAADAEAAQAAAAEQAAADVAAAAKQAEVDQAEHDASVTEVRAAMAQADVNGKAVETAATELAVPQPEHDAASWKSLVTGTQAAEGRVVTLPLITRADPPMPEIIEVRVIGPDAGRWRITAAPRRFTPEPTIIPYADLTEVDLLELQADAELRVTLISKGPMPTA